MSLRDILYTQMIQPYIDTTLYNTTSDNQSIRDDWVQFVKDHADWVKARSMVYDVSETVMSQTRYNLPRYLKQKGVDQQLWWIVLEINDFKSDMDFDRNIYTRGKDDTLGVFMRIYIPPTEIISDLHERWLTSNIMSSSSTLANSI